MNTQIELTDFIYYFFFSAFLFIVIYKNRFRWPGSNRRYLQRIESTVDEIHRNVEMMAPNVNDTEKRQKIILDCILNLQTKIGELKNQVNKQNAAIVSGFSVRTSNEKTLQSEIKTVKNFVIEIAKKTGEIKKHSERIEQLTTIPYMPEPTPPTQNNAGATPEEKTQTVQWRTSNGDVLPASAVIKVKCTDGSTGVAFSHRYHEKGTKYLTFDDLLKLPEA